MPRFVTLLTLSYALFFALPAAAQPLPRVGAEIDQAERDYFGFFLQLDGFEHADVEETPDGGLRFRITHAGGDSVAVVTLLRW